MTAKESLEQLKTKIKESIINSEIVILHGIKEKKYDEVAKMQHIIWGRSDIIFIIDDMLEEIEEAEKV
jgi:hypothetical protein